MEKSSIFSGSIRVSEIKTFLSVAHGFDEIEVPSYYDAKTGTIAKEKTFGLALSKSCYVSFETRIDEENPKATYKICMLVFRVVVDTFVFEPFVNVMFLVVNNSIEVNTIINSFRKAAIFNETQNSELVA